MAQSGSGPVWIIFAILGLMTAAPEAVGSQDWLEHNCSPCLGISSDLVLPAFEIQNAAACSLDRKSQLLFYASKSPEGPSVQQIDHGTLWTLCSDLALSATGEHDADRPPKLAIGLLPVLGGSIATAIVFAVSRARYTPKTVQRQPALFDYQTSQTLIKSLVAGLTATILLSFLEASLRFFL